MISYYLFLSVDGLLGRWAEVSDTLPAAKCVQHEFHVHPLGIFRVCAIIKGSTHGRMTILYKPPSLLLFDGYIPSS
jgi:hypothetical protein